MGGQQHSVEHRLGGALKLTDKKTPVESTGAIGLTTPGWQGA